MVVLFPVLFLCFFFFFFWFDFLCVFVMYFLVCVFFYILFILNLNFNRNRQNIITMKFQDASCPPLPQSVLSSSVEPPSQSLVVSVSSSLDVTAMSVVDGDVCCVKPFLNIFHVPATRCPVFWRNGLKMHLPSAFLCLSSLTSDFTWLIFPLA